MRIVAEGPFGKFSWEIPADLEHRLSEMRPGYEQLSEILGRETLPDLNRAVADMLTEYVSKFLTVVYATHIVRGPNGFICSIHLQQQVLRLTNETVSLMKGLK